MSSFTDQKQRVATEADVKAKWSGLPNGKRFYCNLCGHQFQVGDKWRWVYMGSAGLCNFKVCDSCDGPGVREKWAALWEEWKELTKGKFRFVQDMLDDADESYRDAQRDAQAAIRELRQDAVDAVNGLWR